MHPRGGVTGVCSILICIQTEVTAARILNLLYCRTHAFDPEFYDFRCVHLTAVFEVGLTSCGTRCSAVNPGLVAVLEAIRNRSARGRKHCRARCSRRRARRRSGRRPSSSVLRKRMVQKPPQSTPVSPPFRVPSEQVTAASGAEKCVIPLACASSPVHAAMQHRASDRSGAPSCRPSAPTRVCHGRYGCAWCTSAKF